MGFMINNELMLQVDEKLTRKTAELARLELTDEEVNVFTPQLREVFKYIELLKEVDVKGVEPLTHPFELETPLREDEVSVSPAKILDSAPDVLYDGFKVPSIL